MPYMHNMYVTQHNSLCIDVLQCSLLWKSSLKLLVNSRLLFIKDVFDTDDKFNGGLKK